MLAVGPFSSGPSLAALVILDPWSDPWSDKPSDEHSTSRGRAVNSFLWSSVNTHGYENSEQLSSESSYSKEKDNNTQDSGPSRPAPLSCREAGAATLRCLGSRARHRGLCRDFCTRSCDPNSCGMAASAASSQLDGGLRAGSPLPDRTQAKLLHPTS